VDFGDAFDVLADDDVWMSILMAFVGIIAFAVAANVIEEHLDTAQIKDHGTAENLTAILVLPNQRLWDRRAVCFLASQLVCTRTLAFMVLDSGRENRLAA